MKKVLRYNVLTIPNKVSCDIRLTIDERGVEQRTEYEGNEYVKLRLMPLISLSITRKGEVDETGKYIKPPWNPSDNLAMTKFTLPTFIKELKSISDSMKIPSLYTYTAERLELNEKVAKEVRRVFMISSMAVELSAVVLETEDGQKMEGIKMKFNNETSTVGLTINEINALLYHLKNIAIDEICLALFSEYGRDKSPNMIKPKVDIDIPF